MIINLFLHHLPHHLATLPAVSKPVDLAKVIFILAKVKPLLKQFLSVLYGKRHFSKSGLRVILMLKHWGCPPP